MVFERSVRGHGSDYADVGAVNQDVTDSQQMIEEFPCPMRDDMPARNAGKTRRFEGVAIEDQDAAFKVCSASPAGHPECLTIAQPSHGKGGRAVCRAAAHNTAPTSASTRRRARQRLVVVRKVVNGHGLG